MIVRLTPEVSQAAIRHLRAKDAVMRGVIDQVGPFALKPKRNRFETLVRAIVSQQISTLAAKSILAKLEAAFAPDGLSAEALVAISDASLRAAGISPQKLGYLRDLAMKVHTGVVRLDRLGRRLDEEVIAELIQIKGIGRWTAQMFLIFTLARSDVFPYDDLGVRNGMKRIYRLSAPPDRETAERIVAVWRPYTTVGSWYCWRSLALPEDSLAKSFRALKPPQDESRSYDPLKLVVPQQKGICRIGERRVIRQASRTAPSTARLLGTLFLLIGPALAQDALGAVRKGTPAPPLKAGEDSKPEANAFPAFEAVSKAVSQHFAAQRGYEAGDFISAGQVEPLFDKLDKLNWKVSDRKEILKQLLSDGDWMSKQFATKNGKRFMREIAPLHHGFDRVDRLRELPHGRQQLVDLMRQPGGDKLIEYMTTTSGGKKLGRQVGKGSNSFNEPTGRIYTETQLVKRLKQSYDLAATARKQFKATTPNDSP